MLKSAVVGCGNISSRHLDAIDRNKNTELACVCDIVPERAEEKAKKYSCRAYTDFSEMLEKEKLDVVHICTPHYLHFPMSKAAMEKGINVLCEKPMTMKYEEALEIESLEKSTGVHYGVCFQNRLNDQSVYIKKMIDSGEYGRVLAVKGIVTWSRDEEYYSDDWHGTLSREGGSLCINQAIHTLDLMQWFVSSEIKNVNASVSALKLGDIIETEDTASAVIDFDGGVTGVFFGTLCYSSNSPVMIEITLEKCKILLYDNLNIIYNDGRVEQIEIEKHTGEKNYWGNSHSRLIDEYYDCLKSGRPFPINSIEGKKAIKIISEIYKNR